MAKNPSQSRREMSTHYHDAARQHQEAAHLEKSVAPKQPPNSQKRTAGMKHSTKK